MDRGTDALKNHVDGTDQMEIRQTRRGWLQECLGCEARTEFKVFSGQNQIAHALEDSDCLVRICCTPCYPYTMAVKELNTEAEMIHVERPCRCGPGGCKCCCYQEMTVTSGSEELGLIKEDCYYCVPSFTIFGPNEKPIYKLHPPTCCGGVCPNCCTEGNPCCGKGCCKVPFHVFPASQSNTDGGAEYIGKILKKPKSLATEIFTDANAFTIDFPNTAGSGEKGLLLGSAIFMNSLFFEDNGDN